MSKLIPSYQDGYHAGPIAGAYAYISFLALEFGTMSERLVLNVHPDPQSAAAGLPPIGQIEVTGGEVLVAADPDAGPPAPGRRFPTLGEFMARPDFAAAFGVIRDAIYAELDHHPLLAGAADVP